MKVLRFIAAICIIFILLITVLGQEKERAIEIYKWRNEPIKLLSVKVDGKEIVSKEKFVNKRDDWFSGLTVEVENTSDKTIANIRIALGFPNEPVLKGNPARDYIAYGTRELSEPNLSEPPLKPGEKAVLKIKDYESLRDFLDRVGHSKDIGGELRIDIESVLFTDDTMWSAGQILRRDPDDPKIWRPEKKPRRA